MHARTYMQVRVTLMDKNLKKSNTEVGTVDVALRSGSGRYVHSHACMHAYAHGCLRPRMRTCINGEGVEMGRHVTSILCIQSVHACIVTYSHTRMRAYMRTCVYRTTVKMPCHEHVVSMCACVHVRTGRP